MEKKWRVGDLQTMQGADPRAMTMIGFVLYDETALYHIWVWDAINAAITYSRAALAWSLSGQWRTLASRTP